MIKVIGVRFRTAGKIYFFDPLSFELKKGDHVIVETARGIEYGVVVSDIRMVADDEVVQPLKPVIRIATEKDDEQESNNKKKEKEAFKICLEKIKKHGLEMKLIDAEYTFDNNKVLFYFTADGRIDFRELVKDLASVFRTRIELRQIGVRDETKILGGIGICGRPLCCHAHLSEFLPVSIKMAKEQNLSLNPTKISGVCGRLMCCLKHEEDTYEELNRKLPNVGDSVTTADGFKGEVQSVSVLRQLVKVLVDIDDEKEIKEYHVDDLKFKKRHKKENMNLSAEELKELERLEKEEQMETESLEGAKKENKRESNRENYREKRENRDNGKERVVREPNDQSLQENNRETKPVSAEHVIQEEFYEGSVMKEDSEAAFGNKEGDQEGRNEFRRENYHGNRRDNRKREHFNRREDRRSDLNPDGKGEQTEGKDRSRKERDYRRDGQNGQRRDNRRDNRRNHNKDNRQEGSKNSNERRSEGKRED